ncbi:MAG: hypothetical protein KA175_03225 [Flavobacteriales bacterium]|nr:hypothetical protein [Flavobacteriales bacterium]
MRLASLFVLVLIAACFAWMYDPDAEVAVDTRPQEHPLGLGARMAASAKEALEFDLVQRSCALYVAVRSVALESPIAFDRDLADIPIHWNMCPGGTMVACADVPAANGDTTRVGIPWPY